MNTFTMGLKCSERAARELLGLFEEMGAAYDRAAADQASETAACPDGYVKNAKGWMMPAASVKERDLVESQYVDRFHLLAAAAAAGCEYVRLSAFSEAAALTEMLVSDAGGSAESGAGKVTLQALAGTRRVVIDRRETVGLGAEVAAARDKVMSCVRKWSDGANAHLVALAMAAFQANAAGDLSVSKVAALWRIECDDPEWREAMEALKEAVRPTGTATYLRFHRRGAPEGKWELVEARV